MNPTQDDLDDLIGAFFRAEMPDPWPGSPRPRTEPARAPRREARAWAAYSKLALAASLALLLAGGWLLSGKLGAPASPSMPGFEMGAGGASRLPLPLPEKGKDKPINPDDLELPPGQ